MASQKKELDELGGEGEGVVTSVKRKAKPSPKKLTQEEAEEDDDEEGVTSAKKKAKKTPASPKPKKEKVEQKDYMPKTYPPEEYPSAPDGHLKIVSWNVNGLNAAYQKGFIPYVTAESPDILVLQETKLQESAIGFWNPKMEQLGFKHNSWSCSGTAANSKKGYSSVAVLSKVSPLRTIYGLLTESTKDQNDGVLNEEGRTISTEFDNFFLVNSYIPNSGAKLERLDWRHDTWDAAMLTHLKTLEGLGKHVIFTGDFNVAHTAKEVKNSKQNYNKVAGYTQKEIDGFQGYLDNGFIDTYRAFYPEEIAYTYWGMRFNSYATNAGWRIDYWLCSEDIKSRIEGTHIRKQVYGASDHVPITLNLQK